MNQFTPQILLIIFSILFIHWLGDFCFQTDEMAKGKSKDMICLLNHTFTYTGVWMGFLSLFIIINNYIVCASYFVPITILWFLPITLVCHTVTDYFTSRLNTKLWEKKDVHNFFVSIGFDQILHYVQLFLTFYYLTK